MPNIRVTKEFTFETAHSLEGYDGACSEIHGHSYRLFVTIIGSPIKDTSSPKYGMVMDFGDLKRIVNKTIVDRFDHSLVLKASQGNAELIETLKKYYGRIEIVDYQPTCENMVSHFASDISKQLPENVKLFSIKLHETASSYAEWFASDND
ncbi:MAG: 6-carboxytetrahydropterin synthase [Rikenellaceae bacterium]